MATINTDLPTLADFAKMRDPNGDMAQVAEVLTRANPILETAVWKEGNLDTGHQYTQRTALPSVDWRRLNQGVAPSKGRRDSFVETCGMLSGRAEIDKKLTRMNGGAAYRASENKGFVQAMGNKVENAFIYASLKTAPDQIHGFFPRLDATAGNPAASQIIKHNAAAAGNDQASILLVVWSPDKVFATVPKGSNIGLEHTPLDDQQIDDGTGKKYIGSVDVWDWSLGLVIEDYRQVVRACNIDLSALTIADDTLAETLIYMTEQIGDLRAGRPCFYVPRRISTLLRLQARRSAKDGGQLGLGEYNGRKVTEFDGIPIFRSDAMTITEAPVV